MTSTSFPETSVCDEPLSETVDFPGGLKKPEPLAVPAECLETPSGEASPSTELESLKRQLLDTKREVRESWIRFEEQMRHENAACGKSRQAWLLASVFGLAALLGGLEIYRFFGAGPAATAVFEHEQAVQAAEEHIAAGRRLTAEKNYRDAAGAFSQAIALAPHDARGYMGRGFARFQLEEYRPAAADFDAAVREAPDMFDAYTWRGNAHQRLHDYDAAVRDFGEVIQRAPTIDVGYFNRGLAWFEHHNYPAAVADLTEAVRLRPSDSWNYATRAKAYLAMGKTDEARDDLDTAIRLNSNNAEALFLRAMIHFEANQTQPGLADFAEAVQANPEAVAQLAKTYRRISSPALATR